MAPIVKNVKVSLTNSGNDITVKVTPPGLKVPHSKTQDFRLQWTPDTGSSFPANAFKWKAGATGTPDVKPQTDGTLLSDPYIPNFDFGRSWEYEITVQNATFKVLVDPEVNNLPPTGPGPITPPPGGGKPGKK
jgi:hypothetical protein